jgi:transposase
MPAMDRRKSIEPPLFLTCNDLPQSEGHPFYVMVNRVLAESEFDHYVEGACQKFYAQVMGRPSVAPGVYFRMLLIGYFEGLDSERGIAWRCSDSLSLRRFIGVALDQGTPDHSSVSRTRRLIDLETHREVFRFVLHLLARKKLVKGKTIGVDSTTLEANAAVKSIVRKDSGESYDEFLTRLAQASGIETPTREDLTRIDKDRKNKGSNDDWQSPGDPDARITRMKDGATHLAHKAEHAVDMDSGAIVSVSLHEADKGDTGTLVDTIVDATANLRALADDERLPDKVGDQWMSEVVLDKGYHSNQTLVDLATMNIRSYACEPKRRGRRNWKDQPDQGRGVRQPPADEIAARHPAATKTRRVARTPQRALLRDRRDAASVPARAGEHPQAPAGACGRVQPRALDAQGVRLRHAAKPAGPRARPFCGRWPDYAARHPDETLQRPEKPDSKNRRRCSTSNASGRVRCHSCNS